MARLVRCRCSCGAIELRSGCTTRFRCRGCEPVRKEDSPQYRAHKAVADAIRAGRLIHPSNLPCNDCGVRAQCYDHREYAKPLSVDAVCVRCNNRRGPAIDSPAMRASTARPEHAEFAS